MSIKPFFPARLRDLCAPSPRKDEFLLERRFAEVYASARGTPLDFDGLLAEIREWCKDSGIERHGGKDRI